MMEKKNTVIKLQGKNRSSLKIKKVPITGVRQEKCIVSAPCNLEIVQHQLK